MWCGEQCGVTMTTNQLKGLSSGSCLCSSCGTTGLFCNWLKFNEPTTETNHQNSSRNEHQVSQPIVDSNNKPPESDLVSEDEPDRAETYRCFDEFLRQEIEARHVQAGCSPLGRACDDSMITKMHYTCRNMDMNDSLLMLLEGINHSDNEGALDMPTLESLLQTPPHTVIPYKNINQLVEQQGKTVESTEAKPPSWGDRKVPLPPLMRSTLMTRRHSWRDHRRMVPLPLPMRRTRKATEVSRQLSLP